MFCFLFPQKISEVEKRGILEDEQWDADEEIPLASFVSENKHTQIDADASQSRCHKKEDALGNSRSTDFS